MDSDLRLRLADLLLIEVAVGTPARRVLAEVLRAVAAHAQASGMNRAEFARAARAAFDCAEPEAMEKAGGVSYAEGMRIVGGWLADRKFTDNGSPIPLPYRGRVSFTSLATAARCANPAAALQALRRSGHVAIGPDGRIRLLRAAFIPASARGRAAAIRHAVFDLVGALLHNLGKRRQQAFLQRAATYDNIPAGSLAAIRAGLRREGEELMVRANALLSRRDRDRNPRAGKGRRTRVSFGVYYFEAPVRNTRAR